MAGFGRGDCGDQAGAGGAVPGAMNSLLNASVDMLSALMLANPRMLMVWHGVVDVLCQEAGLGVDESRDVARTVCGAFWGLSISPDASEEDLLRVDEAGRRFVEMFRAEEAARAEADTASDSTEPDSNDDPERGEGEGGGDDQIG